MHRFLQPSRIAIVVAALTVCGCKDKGPSAEGGVPSASVSVLTSATAALAGTGPICGDATMTGKGTSSDPCKSKDPKFRALDAKWTGKFQLGKGQIALTNKMPVELVSADASTYYYDKAGKQLSAKGKRDAKTHLHASESGGIIGSGIPKGGTKEVALGWYEEKTARTCDTCTQIPTGTTTIEVEIDRVWWSDARGQDGFVYWENRALAPDTRPMGGVK